MTSRSKLPRFGNRFKAVRSVWGSWLMPRSVAKTNRDIKSSKEKRRCSRNGAFDAGVTGRASGNYFVGKESAPRDTTTLLADGDLIIDRFDALDVANRPLNLRLQGFALHHPHERDSAIKHCGGDSQTG